MLRERLTEHIKKTCGAEPEYLRSGYMSYAVFRHNDNRKRFAVIMNVSRDKLGLDGAEKTDILNVRVNDPLLADFLTGQPGYFRGYHMSSGNWICVLLDGSVPFEDICRRLDESFRATASKEKRKALRPPKEWLVPANPGYYDIEAAFEKADIIDWKQGAGIKTGDTVFMYVAAPVSAVLYKCLVTETDIPYAFDNGNVRMKSLMKIKLQKRYPPDRFTFDVLGKEYGIYAVRGPRGIPESLSAALGQ